MGLLDGALERDRSVDWRSQSPGLSHRVVTDRRLTVSGNFPGRKNQRWVGVGSPSLTGGPGGGEVWGQHPWQQSTEVGEAGGPNYVSNT